MKKFHKIATLIIIFSFITVSFAPVFAPKAEAQWTVFDPANFAANTTQATNATVQTTKENVLDAIAWMLANTIIERISASTVNWINSGFNGSPAYVTDPASYFQDISDKVAGQAIFNDPAFNFLCSPIQAKIRIALTRSYLNEPNWQCTLTDISGNMEDFLGDFEKGGWDKFFEMTQKPQNNPIDAYLQAEVRMNQRLANSLKIKQDELNWGRGFMSFQKCETLPISGDLTDQQKGLQQLMGGGADDTMYGMNCETVTPGSVIQDQLDNVLGSSMGRLQVSDEINEIVGALLNKLTGTVFSSVGGLLGSSNSGSNNEPSLTRQMLESTADNTVDYFGNTTQPYTPQAVPKVDQNNNQTSTPNPSNLSSLNPSNLDLCNIISNPSCNNAYIIPVDKDCQLAQLIGGIEVFNTQILPTLVIGSQERITAIQNFFNADCDPIGIH